MQNRADMESELIWTDWIMPSSDRSSRDVSMVEAFGVLFYNPESVEFVSELHIVATSYQQGTCDEYQTIEP